MPRDSYSEALQVRRGRGMDAKLYAPDDDEDDTDASKLDGPPKPAAPLHGPVQHQEAGEALPPTPADLENESVAVTPDEPQQAVIDAEIQEALTAGASKDEYDMLKGQKPRSLGERVKMALLAQKDFSKE
jgi:hypothetical protein